MLSAMVAPVLAWQDQFALSLGLERFATTSLSFGVLFIALPVLLTGIAVLLSSPSLGEWQRTLGRYSYALLPLGFAMWLAHYGFHLVTSYGSIVPTTQRFFADLGFSAVGEPRWALSCCAAVADWIPRAEIMTVSPVAGG